MKKWPVILSLIITYFIFAILLNSVGTVILQVIQHYSVSKQDAGILEGFKDLPIAFVSCFVASFLPRLGYKTAIQLGLLLVALACFSMPLLPGFLTTKILFLILGASFALVKVSVYATIGAMTETSKQHASLLNMIEGFFMVGVLLGNWLFSLFVDETAQNAQWLQVYWLLGCLCLANVILIQHIQLSTTRPEPAPTSSNTLFKNITPMIQLMLHSFVIIFVLSAFMYVLIEQSVSTWLPTFNHEILKYNRSTSIQAASIFAGSLAVGRLLAGILLRQIQWIVLVKFCIISMGLLILFILPMTQNAAPDAAAHLSWLNNLPIALLMLPMLGLFMAPIYPAINSAILSALPHTQHAPMTGLIIVFSAIGGTTGSLITGHLFAYLGGQQAFMLLLIPMTILFFTTKRFYALSNHA